jgi:CoA:oxalate CoA-transferase
MQPQSTSGKTRPLSGLRVLDLSRVLAGPYVGRMLADLGAEVVKLEPPEGDITRKWGKVIGELSGYYTQQNAGKRDVCVDLRVNGGPELVRALALKADVVIENFRPGVMAQFGLDYASLSAGNPRLVMLSISGYGQTGPEARRPAYAGVVHAESGFVQRQATLSGAPLADARVSVADMNAALHGLVGTLAALLLRERGGSGQHVDISMIEAMLATDDYMHLALDGISERTGNGVVVNEIWEVVGGPILIAGDFRWVWQRLQSTFELVDPTPPGGSIAQKSEHRHAAVRVFFAGFSERAALLRALDQADLPWGEVKTTRQAFDTETLRARGAVVRIDDRAGGVRPVIQSPYKFSNAESGVSGPAPHRGEHNREVLEQWLGKNADEISALERQGVLLKSS